MAEATQAREPVSIKMPTATRLQDVLEGLKEDDFRFGRIKVDKDRPVYHIPGPLSDPDNIQSVKSFTAVVLLAKKNFYLSDDDRENGKDAREKRELYIVRTDKTLPELIYVNPTSLQNWFKFAKSVIDNDEDYWGVVCEFSAERAESKKTSYKWNKFIFTYNNSLSDAEREYIETLRDAVVERVAKYAEREDYSAYEEVALAGGRKADVAAKPAAQAAAPVAAKSKPAPEAEEERPVARRAAPATDDDAEDGVFAEERQVPAAAAAPKPAARRKPAAAAAEEEPVKTTAPYAEVGDDEEEPLPSRKGNAAAKRNLDEE